MKQVFCSKMRFLLSNSCTYLNIQNKQKRGYGERECIITEGSALSAGSSLDDAKGSYYQQKGKSSSRCKEDGKI
jgi:hypothetical protein